MRNYISIKDIQGSETLGELKAVALRLYKDRELALRALQICDGVYVNHVNKTEGEEEGEIGKNVEPWLALAESNDPKMINLIETVILGLGPLVRLES